MSAPAATSGEALRHLERNGLVARRVVPVLPVTMEYSVTPLGRTLEQPFAALYDWTVEHLSGIGRAQREFDGRAATPAAARDGRAGLDEGAT